MNRQNETYIPLIIIALMLVSTVLSFVFFQKQSLRLDEAQSLWQTSHSALRIFQLVAEDVHVPLYHLLLHSWQMVFGTDVSAARILSLIFFLLCIPMMYVLGRLCYGSRIALFATTLLAISPFMNWYGNEIRMYSLFVFIVLVNQYFFVNIFKNNQKWAWIGFTISAIFGMYTHYFFFLILFTDALFYFYNRRLFASDSFRKFLDISAFLFLLFLPWIIYVFSLGQVSNASPLLPIPTTINIFNTFSEFLFGFQTDHLNTILVSLWPLTILLVFLALRKNKKLTSESIYFVLAFILPNVLAFIVSLTLRPIYLTRYLIFTIPPMYLIISWMVSTYPRKLAILVRTVLIVVMVAMLFNEAISATTPVKENYRGAVEYLKTNAKATDVIVVSAPFTIYPVLYYYNGPSTITTLPVWNMREFGPIPPYSDTELPIDVNNIKADHDNLWLLLSYDQGYQNKIQLYFDTHYQRMSKEQFSQDLVLYEYKLRYDH